MRINKKYIHKTNETRYSNKYMTISLIKAIINFKNYILSK